jgi:NitT/TauT family transport system substrate-binding protein
MEKKWNVDIVLKEADYDSCLVMYGASQCDAVCITNMDVLNPCLSRPSVAILPTSTSFGADALIVTSGITDIKQLKGKNVYGLAKTVSEYCFVRNLEILGEKEKDYRFTNMDPSAAAVAMQQKKKGTDAIVVWNPFVLETLSKRKDARVLFDSTKIPGEIIDMVAVGKTALASPGGEAFACAVIDTFYAIVQRMEDPKTADATLVALGEKFSNLKLASMKEVVKQTKFYKTPEDAVNVLTSKETKDIMKKVTAFCVTHDIVPKEPVVDYGKGDAKKPAMLLFNPAYVEKVKAKNGKMK